MLRDIDRRNQTGIRAIKTRVGGYTNGGISVIKHLLRSCLQHRHAQWQLHYRANKEEAHKDGYTPLYIAAQENHAEIIEIRLAAGTNKEAANEDGWTALPIAAGKDHAKVIVMLLAARADKEVANKMGSTPLYIAAEQGHTDIIDMLVASGP